MKLTLIILTSVFLVGAVLVSKTDAFAGREIHIVNEETLHDVPGTDAEVRVGRGDIKTQVLAMLAEEGIDTVKADKIIHCESSWRPTATHYNRDGSNDAGLWQINSIHGLSVEERMDVEKSTEFAIKLIKKKGFQPWVCNELIALK